MLNNSRLLRQLNLNPDDIKRLVGLDKLPSNDQLIPLGGDVPKNPVYNPTIEPTNPADGTGLLLRRQVPPTTTESDAPINYGQGRVMEADAQAQMPVNTDTPPQMNGQRIFRQYNTAEDIRNKIGALENAPIERRESFWKRFGSGLWHGLENWNPQTGLGGLVGSTITGGLGSAFSPNFDGELSKNSQKQRLLRQLGEAQQMEDWQAANDYRRAQTQTIFNDDARQKERDYWAHQDRQDKINSDAEFKRNSEKDRKRANWYRTNRYFDPLNASEAQKRQLAEFDETPETIGKYDFTKPNTKTVAGITYQYNPNTRNFEESNLPKDGSKAIVDYEITDPNTGVTSKYSVSAEKAAQFKTSIVAAGMQIKAANERAEAQNKIDWARLQQAHQQFAERMKRDYANDEEARKRTAAAELTKLKVGLTSGKLTQDQYDELVKLYQ